MSKLITCKTCGAEIAKSAKVCPNCGAKQKHHTILGIFLVLLGMSLFYNGVVSSSSSGSNTRSNNDDWKYISLDEFDRIEAGMSYYDVCSIIGCDGTLSSQVDIGSPEFKTEIYTWEGSGSIGANANVTFQGGKAVSKAQIGLK